MAANILVWILVLFLTGGMLELLPAAGLFACIAFTRSSDYWMTW